MLPMLEREHDVLAPTLPGHAGGPPLVGAVRDGLLADAVEQAMDEAGFETAAIAGNSLGGNVAFQLAARGRARSVVALAPAGGWAVGDDAFRETLAHHTTTHELLQPLAAHADAIASTPEGRRRITRYTAVRYEHIPAELLAHQIRSAAACDVAPLVAYAYEAGWPFDAEHVTCPVRIVWGLEDRLLPWPRAAARFRAQLPNAEWIELDGVGHCPQLDVPLETAQLILGFTA